MNLRKTVIGASLLIATLGGAGVASAAAVECGGPSGIRVVTVDPAMTPGGLCYTQTGNLQQADVEALGLELQAKENIGGVIEDPNDWLGVTTADGGLSGTWSVASIVWDMFTEVYLGFHFGGGGNTSDSNPDSFIVQLNPKDLSGTWSLGPDNAKLNGLSNIQLITCQASAPECVPDDGGGGGGSAPEPASGLLLALGLGLMAGLRRIGARVART